jgi:hypothetical protein
MRADRHRGGRRVIASDGLPLGSKKRAITMRKKRHRDTFSPSDKVALEDAAWAKNAVALLWGLPLPIMVIGWCDRGPSLQSHVRGTAIVRGKFTPWCLAYVD